MSKAIETTEALAYVIKDDQGGYHVMDMEGNIGPVCRRFEENNKTIVLTKNEAKRFYVAVKVVDAYLAAEDSDGKYPLYPREPQHFGDNINYRIPYANKVKYLTEDEQKEYNEIAQRTLASMNADKKKPLTEAEKLQKQIAAAQAKLDKLLEQAQNAVTE